MFRVILFASAVSAIASGCNSISSTMLNRTDNDVFVGNSNGEPGIHCQARPFKGVPITVRVPTHLDVAIVETIYLSVTDGKLKRVHTNQRNLTVVPAIRETEKVFTVDPKRPAGGTLDTNLKFNINSPANTQYFESIGYNIDDTTIQNINTALGTLLPSLKALNTGGKDDPPPTKPTLLDKLIQETRTVAWKRFDLDVCDFEQQVADFVSLHMNGCNSCDLYHNLNDPVSPGGAGAGGGGGGGGNGGGGDGDAGGSGASDPKPEGSTTSSFRGVPLFEDPTVIR